MLTKRFGPGQKLLYNEAFGTFNDLKIVLDDGQVVNVEDFATDPAVLNGLEARVAAIENQIEDSILPQIKSNLDSLTALTARVDSIEAVVATKQDLLTASYPLSVAGDDVHFSWLPGQASYDERLDALEAGAGSTAIQQLFVRVSSLESLQ